MAQSSEAHKTHVLDLSYDEQDRCGLTVLVNDVRFHITVDPNDLQKSTEKPLYYEYLDKISALREAEEREEELAERASANVHNGKKFTQEGYSSDSGVDVTADGEDDDYTGEEEGDDGEDVDQDSGSAGIELRNWILSGFAGVTAECAPPGREPVESTLYEWYHGPTYFYNLLIKSGELSPELLETTDELNARIEKLIPRLKMPKYIQQYDLPWINANDLTVQSEVNLPEPAHPGKVTHNETGEVYFFKPVVNAEPGPTKREIQILRQLEKLDLEIKVPSLHGFVSCGNSKTEAMGFLLSHIGEPKPLTKLLKASVPESKRKQWSEKSERYVSLLHENNIVWGDAKADNFIVDEHDELWIIDFGGSYTEGWVDPELQETQEGDDMGLEKVQKALEDPEHNTFDPVAEGADPASGGTGNTRVCTNGDIKETASGLFVTEKKEDHVKRKRDQEEEDGGEIKRRKDD